ncbi:tellurite resistance/C4-dicarboxylate transporter family protein [Dactylosporangium sp. AC04546]|uniref:tellurite resistance/C4-dicarboxylate transporter family protein n=1 Tax=Dactylosporangium sp. AC04546 TaxID=2862460 RepID=UPI001EE13297|nr:tellurite resistance/C4-dicarboxylate transporter family protein [Dactylosporangium sp. AC04546]WVK79670.1 tellurite resistance/C4-dicarboxylate transporter family protein [Dactylosporangium sp. AC04546]
MTSDAESSRKGYAGRVTAGIRDLHPSYFAFVMATGIISTGAFLLGPAWLSLALLVIASIGFVVLIAALVIWLARYRSRVVAELQAPERAFGFFAISASCDLLGARFAAAGHPTVTAVLACMAALVWFALTYGVPASLLVARQRDSVLGGIDGTWLLWAVATQSLSIDAATLLAAWPSQSGLLATTAVALWSVGLLLYVLLVALIWQRWLTIAVTAATLSPPYWILMGAAATTVLAGSEILTLPAVSAIAGFVKGTCFVFWSVGTWFIPLLIVLGLWRHALRRWPLRYEAELWTVVFPLGMYSVASLSFGKAAGLSFMEPLSRGALWVAVAAWLLVAAAGLARLAQAGLSPSRRRPTRAA